LSRTILIKANFLKEHEPEELDNMLEDLIKAADIFK